MRNFVDYYIKYTERLNGINESALSAPKKLILQMERQYRKRIYEIAQFISGMEYGHKILMVAGPSSSGKTTSAAMLCEALRGMNIGVLQVSLDNFFLNPEKGPRLPDGSRDYESVHALDMDCMQECLLQLIADGKCDMPIFNFQKSQREEKALQVEIGKNDVVIVEGIHALNPLVTNCLPDARMLKMYISVKQGIKQGDDEVLSARDIRLMRRIVRDAKFRNSPPENTFDMWGKVCEGEEQYIYPFKRLANLTVNTIHIYEPCIFRNTAIGLLQEIKSQSVHYQKAQGLIKEISRFEEIPMDLIPGDSLMREFIGGGIYS